MYADDLFLLAASVSTLQAMINLCGDEIAYLDMCLNVSKSSVIRIGKRFKHGCSSLLVCNETLAFADRIKYLGIHITSGIHFSIDIDKLKAKFYTALNSILSKCGGFMNEMVTFHLINTFCRPLLLYGCDGVSLCKSIVASLAHSFNRIYWRLFKVNDLKSISDIQAYMNHLSIPDDITNRRFRFISRARFSSNMIVYFLAIFFFS